MCLIALRDWSGSHIPNNVIEYNKVSNPDGFGLMWRDKDVVEVRKYAPGEFEYFRNQLKALDVEDVEYAAHWRKATGGALSREMAHPYEYTDASGTPMAVMHNGIIGIQHGKYESDTWAFTKGVLAKLQTGWWDDGALRFLVESAIGWSRMLLMSPDETVLINEDDWQIENAVSYSTTPLPTYTSKKYGAQTRLFEDEGSFAAKSSPSHNGKGGWTAADDLDLLWEEYSGRYDMPLLLPVNGKTVRIEWVDGGHYIEPTEHIPEDYDPGKDDLVGTCKCTECLTEGDFYIIDGELAIDIEHKDKGSRLVGFEPIGDIIDSMNGDAIPAA